MAGEYRLGRKLGEGGYGAVYEAEHPLLKRRAAVKVLHRTEHMDAAGAMRFISEAQAANQIRSRYIVDVFSFGKLPDGRHFYVMDLLDGEPLDRYIGEAAPVAVPDAIQLSRSSPRRWTRRMPQASSIAISSRRISFWSGNRTGIPLPARPSDLRGDPPAPGEPPRSTARSELRSIRFAPLVEPTGLGATLRGTF